MIFSAKLLEQKTAATTVTAVNGLIYTRNEITRRIRGWCA